MHTFAPDVPQNPDDVYVDLLAEVEHHRVKCGPDRSIKSLFLPRGVARRLILLKRAKLGQPPIKETPVAQEVEEVELDLDEVAPDEPATEADESSSSGSSRQRRIR